MECSVSLLTPWKQFNNLFVYHQIYDAGAGSGLYYCTLPFSVKKRIPAFAREFSRVIECWHNENLCCCSCCSVRCSCDTRTGSCYYCCSTSRRAKQIRPCPFLQQNLNQFKVLVNTVLRNISFLN